MLKFAAAFSLSVFIFAHACAADPVDGKFPPPRAPEGKWENLFVGKLDDKWTGMSMSLHSKLISTQPNPDRNGEYILRIDRGPTGLIRSMKPYENFILELEWRHLTEAPNANGAKDTSGNSGLLICHSAFPSPGGPYPREGHEVQVCNLGNGSWYTSHGDVFTLPGTPSQAIPDPRFAVSHHCGHRSMPVEFRGSKTGDWNRVRITCVDGVIQQEVNGALVTSLFRASPRKGYMSFESEGGTVEFRNMRTQELAPDPDLAPKHIAPLLPEPMTCDYITDKKTALTLPKGNCILMADVKGKGEVTLAQFITGLGLPETKLSGRIVVTVRGGKVSVSNNNKTVVPDQDVPKDAEAIAHFDTAGGSFGHVLMLKPVQK